MTDSEKDPTSLDTLIQNGSNKSHSPNVKFFLSGHGATPKAVELDLLHQKITRLKVYMFGLSVLLTSGIITGIILIVVLFQNLSSRIDNHEHKPTVGQQMAYILQQETLCLDCDSIRLGPSPQEDNMLNYFIRKYEKGKEKCCVTRPDQLLRLLDLSIERRYREELAKGNIKSSSRSEDDSLNKRPAAHLLGSLQRQEQPKVPGRQVSVSRWVHEDDIAFTNYIKYRHGRLVVPDSGFYFVYSQINFIEVFDSTASHVGDSNSLSHYLYRYNVLYTEGGEEPLAQNSITKSNQRREFGEYTSYLGGLFHLRQGDEIFVKVSNVSLINRHSKLNYFGLFRV